MGEARAVVLLEAPHRIEALAQALSALGSRLITVGRELTKQFETVHTLPAHTSCPPGSQKKPIMCAVSLHW
jgi:16S rRNA (cytidine1402-2'-O)-methyltransferase